MTNELLDAEHIQAGLNTRHLPRTIIASQQVASTMDVARTRLRGAHDDELPLLITTDEQTAGRGRRGRYWAAPAGSALLLSLAVRPTWLAPHQATTLIWLASVALCAGIADATGLQPRLKWPNDVVLATPDQAAHWSKTAGILLEASSNDRHIEWAIIGCGLNISASPPADGSGAFPPTHLNAVLGRPVSRLAVLQAVLRRLDDWYGQMQQGDDAALFGEWRTLLMTLGQRVEIRLDDSRLVGYAEDVEPSGALRVRDDQGQVHIVSGGDIGLVA